MCQLIYPAIKSVIGHQFITGEDGGRLRTAADLSLKQLLHAEWRVYLRMTREFMPILLSHVPVPCRWTTYQRSQTRCLVVLQGLS
jgi:hypothetical protein